MSEILSLQKLPETTDIGLQVFREQYAQKYQQILEDTRSHRDLAYSLVEKVPRVDILQILANNKIDTNIKFEILLILSRKHPLSQDEVAFLLLGSKYKLSFHKYPEGAYLFTPHVLGESLLIFSNGRAFKGMLSGKITNDEGEHVFIFSHDKFYSTGEKLI